MAKPRTSLSSVDLTPPKRSPGRPRKETTDRGQASTLRLPPDYWHRLRIAAAIRRTTSVALVQEALDTWFKQNPLPPGVTPRA